ncbi:transposase family protein [bacterium]|nr:transposase family protein [bacterium]
MAQAMEMSKKSVDEYTEKLRERYARMTGRQAKGKLLDEYTAVTGFERKYAIKVLGGSRRKASGKSRRGRKRKFTPAVGKALKTLWQAMEQPCGKRMRDMIPLWIEDLKGAHKTTRESIIKMSPATIDRWLAAHKVDGPNKRLPPRSENAIKALVEIRAESWDESEPGWTEIDTVAHCGGDMSGNFIWTLTSVDIVSGWTEVRPVWNRGKRTTLQGVEAITRAQPFALKGIDSDNGGEFLNHHLYQWARDKKIKQTRSRPYRKNDQAHVEQKNYTHVRQLLGYDRIGHQEVIKPLTKLLEKWSLFKNLYCVTMEQISKTREGSKEIRRHAKLNRTPAQRLLEGGKISVQQRAWIEKQFATSNPFEMKEEIEGELKGIWKLVEKLDLKEAQKWQSDLADEGPPPLRSGSPSSASDQQKNQAATVSS